MAKQPLSAPVTILFTDLVNSTEVLQRVGDELGQRIFRAHHKALRDSLAAHGGRKVKWQGDGLMAVFASPADAVRCSIAIQMATRRPTAGEILEVRVGLNVGEVLMEESDYFGTPVVVARRLCDRAKGGQILCGALVAGFLTGRQAFRFRNLGPLRLKGITEPITASEVLYTKDEPPYDWTDADAEQFRRAAAIAVPARDEQIATLLVLMPAKRRDSFRVVELGCGYGALAFAILDYFPNASVTALEKSPGMRSHAAERLAKFGPRASVEAFDLASSDWLPRLDSADCVVSSLAVHHLSDGDKVRLFAAVFERLTERGALLIADVVEPQQPEHRVLFEEAYDHMAAVQSVAKTGSDKLFQKYFRDGEWNIFRSGDLDEYQSPLSHQLTWLEAAGFEVVDCFWLQAGFAIFGGYKTRSGATLRDRRLSPALESARLALDATSQPHHPPRLLKDVRAGASSRWEAALARRHGRAPGRACRCGHTRPWHDFYHLREDGEWEVCWCESGDCGIKERCELCECIEFTPREPTDKSQ
jgi:class 3 adenylate cyclase/trans-aconitate methyltransferase